MLIIKLFVIVSDDFWRLNFVRMHHAWVPSYLTSIGLTSDVEPAWNPREASRDQLTTT
jgi:hypothetical protein